MEAGQIRQFKKQIRIIFRLYCSMFILNCRLQLYPLNCGIGWRHLSNIVCIGCCYNVTSVSSSLTLHVVFSCSLDYLKLQLDSDSRLYTSQLDGLTHYTAIKILFLIQWDPYNCGLGRGLLDSSFDFKKSNKHSNCAVYSDHLFLSF